MNETNKPFDYIDMERVKQDPKYKRHLLESYQAHVGSAILRNTYPGRYPLDNSKVTEEIAKQEDEVHNFVKSLGTVELCVQYANDQNLELDTQTIEEDAITLFNFSHMFDNSGKRLQ